MRGLGHAHHRPDDLICWNRKLDFIFGLRVVAISSILEILTGPGLCSDYMLRLIDTGRIPTAPPESSTLIEFNTFFNNADSFCLIPIDSNLKHSICCRPRTIWSTALHLLAYA